MNKFSVVFFAVLFLLSMQKKDENKKNVEKGAEKENSTNVVADEKKESEVAASNEASSVSSAESDETIKSNPSKKKAKEDGDDKKKKDDDKATPEKKTDDKKKSKKSAGSGKTWKEEVEAIRKEETELKEAIKKVQEVKVKKSDDAKIYKESVCDLGDRIVKIESHIAAARELLKTFNEDVEKKKKNGDELDSAVQDDIKKAKEEDEYLNKLSGALKKWKLSFCDHFLAICKKISGKDKKIEVFSAEKEGGSNLMFYGCIVVAVCIAFVLGYCIGGRKN